MTWFQQAFKLVSTACALRPSLDSRDAAAINAATDFGLALYPIALLWHVQMSKRVKVGVCMLLSLGMFMGVCAILKGVQLARKSCQPD